MIQSSSLFLVNTSTKSKIGAFTALKTSFLNATYLFVPTTSLSTFIEPSFGIFQWDKSLFQGMWLKTYSQSLT